MSRELTPKQDRTRVIKLGGGVLKKDGSGLESADKFSQVWGGRQVLVLSALKGVTNTLLDIVRSHDSRMVDEVISLYQGAAEEKISDRELYDDFIKGLKFYRNILTGKKSSLAIIGSLGERISADLFYGMLKSRGQEVSQVKVSRDFPIRVNGEEEDANPNLEETNRRMKILQEKLEANDKVIFPGYLGVDGRGKIKLLGRGGSDTTAVLVAHGLGIDEVYLVKETKGVLTADPNIVPNARTINHGSYAEAENMSLFGASIFHHKATLLSRKLRVKIRVPYSKDPKIITEFDDEGDNGQDVKFVGGFENVVKVSGTKREIEQLEDLCQENNLSDFYHSLGGTMNRRGAVILDRAKYQELTGKEEEQYSVIGVVGDVMGEGKGYESRGSGALVKGNITIIRSLATERYDSEGAYLSYVVEPKDFIKGVRVLHREFIEKN